MKRLDLRKDFADLYRFVTERVASFDPTTNDGPGKGKRVKRIDFGYQFDQASWAALVFDTRSNAEPDGQWNAHIVANWLERPKWLAASEANEDEPILFSLPDGSKREIPPGGHEEFAVILGDLLRGVLLKARSDGVFIDLPKSPRCELGVEEHDGAYGWPIFEERGRVNLGYVGKPSSRAQT
jgi:hypothetical protein